MEITACHNTSSSMVKPVRNWQTIALAVGLVLLFLLLACIMYRFVAQTNNKLKAVEQALNALNARQQSLPPQPQPQPQPHIFMRHHEPVVVMPPPPPPPPMPQAPIAPSVVLDPKTLDKELTEELKELSVEVPEGRVDTDPEEKKV